MSNFKCYCNICNTELIEFSIFIKNRSFRQDMMFDKNKGIISIIDKEYYGDEYYKLIYKCQCGNCEFKFKPQDINQHNIIKDKSIINLINDVFQNGVNSYTIGNIVFEKVKDY